MQWLICIEIRDPENDATCIPLNFQESSGKRELSLSNVAGIFYILIAGLVVAIVLASSEFICRKTKLLEKVNAKDTSSFFTNLPFKPTCITCS